ncbi:MAG: tetratricopeptide repeat protein, partial [Rhodobacteraceae bacterium]|nr:tetratricopeptide repeat protein [Paracoccaceae bacterium]
MENNERSIIDGLMEDAEAAIAAGAVNKAKTIYTGILAIDSNHVLALRQLAIFALQDGRAHEALELFQRALELKKDDPDLYHGIGTALRQLGHTENAMLAFDGALRIDRHHHPALYDLALLYQKRRDFAAADRLYERASMARWNHFDSILNRGVVLYRQDKLPEAERWFHHAALLNDTDPRPLINLAMIYRVWGRLDAAVSCLKKAVSLDAENPVAHWNLANALLASGNLADGFEEYEWRFRRPGRGMRSVDVPLWDGEPLSGKSILVTVEQGIGDAIHFVRFVADLADRGASVVLECHPGTASLMTTARGVARTVTIGEKVEGINFHVPLMSIPHKIGLTFDAIPARVPYLSVPAGTREPVIASPGLKVGLVWRGNPQHENDAQRSLPLSNFAPLLDREGISFFSLQVGDVQSELESDAPGKITDLARGLKSFADTAAVVSALDL